MSKAQEYQRIRNQLYGAIYGARAAGFDDLGHEIAKLAVNAGLWKDPNQLPGLYFEELRAEPVHDPANYWFVSLLEEHADAIQAEVAAMNDRSESGFNPVGENIYDGTWDQVFLYNDGRRYEENCAHFPVLSGVIDRIGEVTSMTHGCAILSWIQPGTTVTPHCGPTNARIRCHLGIQIPDGVRIRILDDWMTWEEGKCLVFDDSFEHEVIHEGDAPRIILLLDFWHPDATDEIKEIAVKHKRDTRTPGQKLIDQMRCSGIQRLDLSPDGGHLDVELKPGVAESIKAGMEQQGLGSVGFNKDGEFQAVPRLLSLLAGSGS